MTACSTPTESEPPVAPSPRRGWVRVATRALAELVRAHWVLWLLMVALLAAGIVVGYRQWEHFPAGLPAGRSWPRWMQALLMGGRHESGWSGYLTWNLRVVLQDGFNACVTLGTWAGYATYRLGLNAGWRMADAALCARANGHGVGDVVLAGYLPHGVIEVSAITLAAAVFARTGLVWLWPLKGLRRWPSFVRQVRNCGIVLCFVTPALLLAAVIEAGITPKLVDRYVNDVGRQPGLRAERGLLRAGSVFRFALSPDGSRLAYTPFDRADLYVRRLGGPESKVATAAKGDVLGSLSWSPDGKRLCFTTTPSSHGVGGGIFLLDVTRGTAAKVPGGPKAYYSPAAWSPDGSQLAVCAREWQGDPEGPNRTSLWIVNLRSGKWRRVTTAEPSARVAVGVHGLAWSPDGRQLAFEAWPPLHQSAENNRIWAVRADGTGLRPLTPGPADRSPAWSPDGQWIAYISDRADKDWEDFPNLSLARLDLISPDGKRHATNLARVDSYSSLSWTPQGELLYQRFNAILLGAPRLP
jgi:hypothetical protein